MKKSTKYLLCLIGAFVITAILFPVILHQLPQEESDSQKHIFDFDLDKQSSREVPIVDMNITTIDIDESILATNVIIEGVESTKDQAVELTMSGDEKFINAININHDPKTSTLRIEDTNEESMMIDSLVIKVAQPANKLSIKALDCQMISIKDLKTPLLEVASTGSLIDTYFCTIGDMNITLDRSDRYFKFYINTINSKIASLNVSTNRGFSFAGHDNVDKLAINAKLNIEVTVEGYEGDIDLQKNGNKVFIDRN